MIEKDIPEAEAPALPYVGSYLGAEKIVDVDVCGETPGGDQLIWAIYESGAREKFVLSVLQRCLTAEVSTATDLRAKRCDPVIAEFLKITLENGIKVSEIEYIGTVFTGSLRQHLQQARAKKFGVSHEDEILVNDIDDTLKAPEEGKAVEPTAEEPAA